MPRIVLGRVLPLVAILIASTLPLSSKDKMKIEIVDTASTIEVGTTTSSVPASPARSVTHCRGISGIYAKVYGYDCTTTNYPEMPAHDVNKPYIASSYYARAVMPDGAHVWLTCDLMAKKCAPIDPWSPAQTRETCDNQPSATALYLRVCLRINSETKTLGFYGATQDGDNVVIYGPSGKREYRILRSWGSWSSVESQPLPKTDAVQESQQSDVSASPVSHDSSSEPANSANAKSDLETAESALCGVIDLSNAFDAVQIRDQAEKGNAFAQWIFGTNYECGNGVSKDYKQAAVWFRKAANQDDYDSQLVLGRLYTGGRGVPQSYEEAYFWLNLACANAPEDARHVAESLRDKVMSKLSAEQVARVQARANEWIAQHERTGPNK